MTRGSEDKRLSHADLIAGEAGEGMFTPHSDSSVPQTSESEQRTKRVVRNGTATNALVLSAYGDGNEKVFPRIMRLYVKPGSIVADVTYGKGVFWRDVPSGLYDLRPTDIQDGVDCRHLPMPMTLLIVSSLIRLTCTPLEGRLISHTHRSKPTMATMEQRGGQRENIMKRS